MGLVTLDNDAEYTSVNGVDVLVSTPDSLSTSRHGVLAALDCYVEVDELVSRRTRTALGLGENDLRALQYIVGCHRRGERPSARSIAAHLGISTASTTVLLDRLEASGNVRRTRNPVDRRAIEIEPTVAADAQLRLLLSRMNARRSEVLDSLSIADAEIVRTFLERMCSAMEDDS